ncbi:GNAT family N-acetyltransferase [Roseomonas sp. OT10]|uniref:GNAT family N-acetyltransferase n=1 Tax=Roseomonas cutis TaxID=2897332 RepID=UPI001E347D78|nr:GNAT family N-acetyltransferase [Roseomonas sp. OT10]UFN50606.1 GNAT family N-acetyltransferase [Roseomonas sp. OT10]
MPDRDLTLELTDAAPPEARDAVLAPLMAFNLEQAGPPQMRPLAVLLRDEEGMIQGGLWGRTGWSWLFVELLVVPDPHRGRGLGTALLRQAEEEALRRGCVGAWLDTFSFQAPGFYLRQGYEIVGTIRGYPPGHSRHFLRKRLVEGEDE